MGFNSFLQEIWAQQKEEFLSPRHVCHGVSFTSGCIRKVSRYCIYTCCLLRRLISMSAAQLSLPRRCQQIGKTRPADDALIIRLPIPTLQRIAMPVSAPTPHSAAVGRARLTISIVVCAQALLIAVHEFLMIHGGADSQVLGGINIYVLRHA